jgi:hypothetical protein
MNEKFVQDLEREAEGLRWLGKEAPARALDALAMIIRAKRMESMSALELFARTIQMESQLP